MPRRDKDSEVTETEAIAPAGDQPADETPKAPKVDERPLGPTTTRTGAAAMVIKSPKGKRVFTAGGDKGAKIAELLKTKPEMPRREIAALVGCSQSRVAEVARVLGLANPRPASTGEPVPEKAEEAAPANA